MMIAKSVRGICFCHLRQTVSHSLESLPNNAGTRASSDSIRLFSTSNVSSTRRKYEELNNLGRSPRDMKEMKNMGLEKYMKKHRQYAQFNYQEWRYPQTRRPIDVSCTMGVTDPDVQEEATFKDKMFNQARKTLLKLRDETFHHRAIKKKVPEFHRKRFPAQAQEIYNKTHDLLNTKNWTIDEKENTEDALHSMVTEFAYKKMVHGLDNKTVNWKFVESIEPPRVVRLVISSMINQENTYAQVTVRFHTKQMLSIYDRFGRFMHGSTDTPRNVLEYVVFERHLPNPYGQWRIHAKLPSNAYEREPALKTVAVMQTNQKRAENERWHDEERKVSKFKWYPERKYLIEKFHSFSRIRTGDKYWRSIRKRKSNSIGAPRSKPGYGLKRMRGKSQQMVWKKLATVLEARRIGKLPYPPKTEDDDSS